MSLRLNHEPRRQRKLVVLETIIPKRNGTGGPSNLYLRPSIKLYVRIKTCESLERVKEKLFVKFQDIVYTRKFFYLHLNSKK